MKDIDFQFPYWGPFILEAHIEQEFADLILEKGIEAREKNLDHTRKLAGQMDYEYYFEKMNWFYPGFSMYMDLYVDSLLQYQPSAMTWLYGSKGAHDHFRGQQRFAQVERKWNLKGLWINFQQAGEYNPPHNHDGDMSFVIYLQIPKEIAKEHEEKKEEHNNEGPGAICFSYGEQMSFCISRYWRLPTEGMIIMFPAWVQHYVHSFTSDVERISVSGNLEFVT